MAGVSGLNVPMIYGMIVSMLFETLQGEDVTVEFDRRIITFGLGVKVKLKRGDKIHTVSRAIDPREFRSEFEAKVATPIVVEIVQELHRLVKPQQTALVDGKVQGQA